MTLFELSLCGVTRARLLSIAAGAFSMILQAPPSYGASGAVINPATVSCKELKDNLERTGSLTILTGQKDWDDTIYGPGAPQCEFWQKPMFTYVNASDGACGLGYVCVQRITGGR